MAEYRSSTSEVLLHPEIGEIELDCQSMLTEHQGQILLDLTAASSDAVERLALLRLVGQERFDQNPLALRPCAYSADRCTLGYQGCPDLLASGPLIRSDIGARGSNLEEATSIPSLRRICA